MKSLNSIAQSSHFQRFSRVVVSTICVVASLALAYYCITHGLGFERHGKIIGDLTLQWRGTLLEYGAFTYTMAMLFNGAVALPRVFATDSQYTATAALKQMLYSFGSPIVTPFIAFQHMKEHGHEHWDLICRNTYFFQRS